MEVRVIGRPARHIAYPVGDPSSAAAREFALATEAGYALAVTTRPGMLFAEHAAHLTALPRVSLNGLWQDLGYLDLPQGLIINPGQIKEMPANKVCMSRIESMATPAMPTSPVTRGWSES